MRRATKRGYSFPSNAVPSIPKTVTEKTLERFKAITPETLYKKAIYVSPEGTRIKGTARKKQERSEASKKAAETRKRWADSQVPETPPERPPIDSDPPTRPPIDSEPPGVGEGPAPTPETDTILHMIETMIENWQPSRTWSPTLVILKTSDKNLLKSVLEGAIQRDGREAVAQRCQDHAEELVGIVNRVLYGSGNSYKVRGVEGVNQDIQRFATIIGGSSPTVAESMRYTEEAEETAYSYDE